MNGWYTVRDLATVRQVREMYGNVLAKLQANQAPYKSLSDAIACAAGVRLLRDQYRLYGKLLEKLERLPPDSSQRFPVPTFENTPRPAFVTAAMQAVVP